MSCPHHQTTPALRLRADLPPLTERLKLLPIDDRGYPIPFFVDYIDGKPDFRVADGRKWARCIRERLCWCCGQPMGTYKVFAIGPMCAINRTTAEPPVHLDCAQWSVKGCPFLSRPKMVRREDEKLDALKLAGHSAGGIMIDRNPGVTCLWTTKTFRVFNDSMGGHLIEIGEPLNVTWHREGRTATRAEIEESITTGLPKLRELCDCPEAHADLEAKTRRAMKLLPEK